MANTISSGCGCQPDRHGSKDQESRFANDDKDGNGPWRTYPLDVRTEDSAKREKYRYEVELPSGRKIKPSPGRHWSLPELVFLEERKAGRIYFGKDGDAMPTKKVYLRDARQGVIARTWWTYKEVGGNQDAKREVLALFGDSGFITPKPEGLLQRILQLATNPGDLVLDSFLGSGTTAAVAHKMGRKWIGVEIGEHAVSHCAPRLGKVIGGEQGGISEGVGWQGGGGFRFYRLGAPVFDADGAINPGIAFAHLAAHVWFSETGTPLATEPAGPWLGEAGGRGLALLYNGILGDKSVSGGNVLTVALLKRLRADSGGFVGAITVYGEASRLGPDRLAAEGVTFKQTPYEVRAR